MKSDFDMIVQKFNRNVLDLSIYPLGDLHIGSKEFDEKHWAYWKQTVLNDPNGKVVIIGDMIENGLKGSKTNSYEATMRPSEQKQWLYRELLPLKHRIIGACRGNHEYRSVNETDDCPLYDVMAKLDLEDLYRENMAFLKVALGHKNKDRQFSYNIVLAHGASKNRTDKFSYTVDGMDVLITGHTHSPSSDFPSKIVIDPYNEKVRMAGFTRVVVPSFAGYGGYSLRGMYLPQDIHKIPVIKLDGLSKGVEVLWM